MTRPISIPSRLKLLQLFAMSICVAVTMSTAFAQAENPEQTVRSFIQDSSTTIAVKSKIAEDPKLSQMALSIETINGIVQISGIARSEADKEKITELTQQVQGVSKIHNLIRIKPSTF